MVSSRGSNDSPPGFRAEPTVGSPALTSVATAMGDANRSNFPVSTIRQRISHLVCHEAPEMRGTLYPYHDLERVARGRYRLVED